MIVESISKLMSRDLQKLKEEIGLYKTESRIWVTDKSIANSAGNLCLHLVGNLNTYIGAVIGSTGYVRNRDLEFSAKNIPRRELIAKVENTINVVQQALLKLKDEDLHKEYPQQVFAEKTSTGHFLLHLAAHLGYHLGQVNYHRRLLDE